MTTAKLNKVENKNRKWNENKAYFPLQVELEDGSKAWLMFTYNQLNVAYERAKRNPEDIPEEKAEESSVLGKLFGWLVK